MQLINSIKDLDTKLFLYLNGMHTPWMDTVMFYLSYRYFWIPLYAVFLFLVWKHYRQRLPLVVIVTVLMILAADQTSVHLFKNVFLRYRPCHNLLIQDKVHLNDGCGGTYGFISSHAANTFALALFLGLLLRKQIRYFFPALLVWAALVSYSRIYNGVHYPADVAVGALVGAFIGWLFHLVYRKLELRFYPN